MNDKIFIVMTNEILIKVGWLKNRVIRDDLNKI
jgi:hypothetical protein